MSQSAFGIPLNIGLTHGTKSDGTWSSFTNCLPDYFTMLWNKPIMTKSIEERDSLDTTYLLPGNRISTNISGMNVRGMELTQYFWTGLDYYKIGIPAIPNYFNIYKIITPPEDLYKTPYPKASFFMTCQTNTVQSNVTLLSLINNIYMLKNNELMCFSGLNGRYNLNAEATTSIIPTLLYVNLMYSVSGLLNTLANKYKTTLISFNTFVDYLIMVLDKIVKLTYYDFYVASTEFDNVDISMLPNYIAACFASLEAPIKATYNGISKDIPMIDPMVKLAMIDTPLVNRLKMTPRFNLQFAKILQQVDDLIYNPSSQENYYPQLNILVNYFIGNSENLRKAIDINNFITEICDGIAGLVNLALMFALISSAEQNTKTSLYLHFIVPEKYRGIM